MLDGLLHNESSIEILEHATDTAGATEMIFAMFPHTVIASLRACATWATASCS